MSKFPLVWWASGLLTIRTDTSFTPAPLNRDRSFYLSIYLAFKRPELIIKVKAKKIVVE